MAGSPTKHVKTTEPCILNVLLKMEDKGKSPATIETVSKALIKISKNADINNPDTVERYIARLKVTDGYKRILCNSYKAFTDYYKIQWEKPKYTTQSKMFKVPTNEKLNLIIAGSGYTLSLKLQISKECGLRPIEVVTLTPEQIDTDHKALTPITAKHGSPRTLPITENLCNALKTYIAENNLKPNEKLFKITPHSFTQIYRASRNKIAEKINDPTIRQIRLYDFRHYFGTRTYQKTQSIAFTARQMGHKNWKNTQVYVDLEAILNSIEEEYQTAVASNLKEACKLIEQGFQYVTEMEGAKIFKKRK